MEHIKDMQPKGDFSLSNIKGISEVQKDSLMGKTLVAAVGNQASNKIGEETMVLLEQFGDRTDFKVISINEVAVGADGLTESNDQNHLWQANQSSIEHLGLKANVESPYWALIDNKGKIRNFYPKVDFEKLILQTAMILPIEQRKKINLKRDDEM